MCATLRHRGHAYIAWPLVFVGAGSHPLPPTTHPRTRMRHGPPPRNNSPPTYPRLGARSIGPHAPPRTAPDDVAHPWRQSRHSLPRCDICAGCCGFSCVILAEVRRVLQADGRLVILLSAGKHNVRMHPLWDALTNAGWQLETPDCTVAGTTIHLIIGTPHVTDV